MYVESLKNGTDELICKAEIETQMYREQRYGHQGGMSAEGCGMNWEILGLTSVLPILCIK